MTTILNKGGERHAAALIKAGHYDVAGAWSFSAADGDALLGASGADWDAYGQWHLGEDDTAAPDSRARWKYPTGKDGKVWRRALGAIRSRAAQAGADDVFDAAGRLMALMDDMESARDAAHPPAAAPAGADDGRASGAPLRDRAASAHPPISRTAAVAVIPASVDAAARTVDMVISTGAAVRRYDPLDQREYDEVLAIAPDAVRLGRLNAGAPLIDSHDYFSGIRAVIGSIVPGSARIEGGTLKARAKFSTNPAGDAAWTDVRDGILRHVSVGYFTHREQVDPTTTPATYRATDWEPYEVSVVAMPADPRAGFRSASPSPTSRQGSIMPDSPGVSAASSAVSTPVPPAAPDAGAIRAAAVAAERQRIAGIEDIGRRLGLPPDFVSRHRAEGTDLDAFRSAAIDQVSAQASARVIDTANPGASLPAPAVTGTRRTVDMKPGQMAARLFRLMGASKGDPERAMRLCRLPAWDDGHIEATTRALQAGIGSGGGFLIPEEYASEVIDLLRPRAVVRRMGATQIPIPGGNLNMPRLQGGAQASYVGEAAGATATAESFGNIKLSEKKLMALVPISNDLLKFSSPQADQVVLNDMVRQIAVTEDQAFIRGSGTQFSPKGMRYWAATTNSLAPTGSNILTSSGSTNADVDADLTALMSTLEQSNVNMIQPGWLLTPRSKNYIRSIQSTTGQFVYREEMDTAKTLFGFPFGVTTNIPTNLGSDGKQTEIYLADFVDAIIADVPGLEIEISREAAYLDSSGSFQAAFSQDVTVIRAIERHDFAMRHDASVAVLTGVEY